MGSGSGSDQQAAAGAAAYRLWACHVAVILTQALNGGGVQALELSKLIQAVEHRAIHHLNAQAAHHTERVVAQRRVLHDPNARHCIC